MESQEQEKLLPEEGESVGPVKKKREKKKKSKEERSKDRRIIFIFLLVTLAITAWFYLWPKINSKNFELPRFDLNTGGDESSGSGWKGYSEVKM